MPGTEVSIGLNGPLFSCPGFGSNVSICVGPPVIHNRMQARLRCGFFAVSSAKAGNQRDIDMPNAPHEVSRSQSRRLNCESDCMTFAPNKFAPFSRVCLHRASNSQ